MPGRATDERFLKQQARSFDWDGVRERIETASAALDKLGKPSPEAIRQILAQRAAQLAEPPAPEDEGEQLELLLVRLGRELYGLGVQHVSHIKLLEHVTRVPRVPPWVAGVVNERGRILPLVDLGLFLGLRDGEPDQEGQGACIVVVEAPDTEMALLVDDVLAVETFPGSQLREMAYTATGVRREYVLGAVAPRARDGGLAVVLDLPALLGDEGLAVNDETV